MYNTLEGVNGEHVGGVTCRRDTRGVSGPIESDKAKGCLNAEAIDTVELDEAEGCRAVEDTGSVELDEAEG